MAAQRLTDRIVKDLPTPASGSKVFYDPELTGFGCRVTAAGAKAFVLNYRIQGRERRLTIGKFPAWTVAAAREEAKQLRRDIDLGRDPLGERDAERTAPTVADLVERYAREHLPRKRARSAEEDRTMARQYVLPTLGRLKVSDVRHGDVDKLHREITAAGKPTRANRVLALLSKMFSLAIKWGWRETANPCHGVERNDENKRERFLTPAELQRLAAVLDRRPERQSANVVRLLLLTGARRNEVLTMQWRDLDFARARWTKPSAHVKTRKEHAVPLSAPALALLTGMQAERAGESSPYVFPGRDDPDQAQQGLKTFWRSVCKEAGLEGVRLHDLRHTYASILASSGLSLPVIGALLGHTQAQTTQRYSHLLDDPLREATERVSAVLAGRVPAEVVPIKGRRA